MMAGMDVDSPPAAKQNAAFSPRELIVQRLVQLGIPLNQIDPTPSCLVDIIKNNESSMPNLVSSILPTDKDVSTIQKLFTKDSQGESKRNSKFKELYTESLFWIQWLMFRCNPQDYLKEMAQKGERAVCGAVWGQNDLAYHCRTCEQDPTCAICVPCFQNGTHTDHDYSIIYTGGGCCDCGDETAWKREGFCSKHKGTSQVQPLSEEFVSSAGPVIDILLVFWREKIMSTEHSDRGDIKKVTNKLSLAIVRMFLDFCNSSESLLSFVSKRIFECNGLLDVLVRAERFLEKKVVKKLYELLLKLLGEPLFKYEFAKVLIQYYPLTVKEIIKGSRDLMREKHALLPTFTVQIFTVPTLTPRLVREFDLLGVLLGCLRDTVISCVGEDGRLEVNKLANIYETALRLVGNIRHVMSPKEVQIYIAQERPDISRAWLRLLCVVQGMDPQMRATGIHIEEENDNVLPVPFLLCSFLGNVHSVLVDGAYLVAESKETKNDKNDSSDCAEKYDNKSSNRGNCPIVPTYIAWLIFECLKTIDSWLDPSSAAGSKFFSIDASSSNGYNYLTLRKKLFGIEREEALVQDDDPMDLDDIAMLDEDHGEMNSGREALKLLNSVDWPDIKYDVSSQEISFHIPLHRLLSLLLRKALKTCYDKAGSLDKANVIFVHASFQQYNFFGQVLKGAHPSGFSSYIMESPLRLRVFCAQVHAGMWRKNGDAAILSCEWYRNVQWLETGLEMDLFLLQCCAALAPPDLFVKRIQERFGLTNYTSFNLADHKEYEPVLVNEMLTLIIQIVKERRFCGLSVTDNLRRELVYKLAIGDATHSQILKALPRDLSENDQLHNFLDELAEYSKPSGMKQGKYSLRKEFWKEFDLYHPRWNSRDLQAAEERYSCFCKVPALNAQLPRWTPVFDPLNTISRIATSKPALQIIRAVVFYAVFTETPSLSHAPDFVLITALHLLSLAVDICETQLSCQENNLFSVITSITEEFETGATDEVLWKNQSLLSLLVTLMRKHKERSGYNNADIKQCSIASLIETLLKKFVLISPTCADNLKRLAPDIIMPHPSLNTAANTANTSASSSDADEWREKARERQTAIMEKMRAQQCKFIASLNSEPTLESDITKHDQKTPIYEFDHAPEESALVCSLCRGSDSESPLCFLILLQKSRLTSFVERGPVSWDMHPVAKKRVNETSGDASSIPVRLIENGDNYAFEDLFGEGDLEAKSFQPPNASYNSSISSLSTLEILENDVYQSVMGEIFSTQCHSNVFDRGLNCSTSQAAVGSPQCKSASLSRTTSKNHLTNISDSIVPAIKLNGFGPKHCDGIHISSCGHAVHQECHDRYLTSLKQRHLGRLGFEGGNIVDPDLGELLCPVCRSFSNSILPAFPSTVSNKYWRQMTPSTGGSKNNLQLPLALSLLQTTAKIVGHSRFQNIISLKQNVTVKPAIEPALRKLYMMYFSSDYGYLSESAGLVQSLVFWDTFTYTLVSTEIAARGKPNSFAQSSLSLQTLCGELQSSSELILSSLMFVAQSTHVSSHHDMLLRFKGIQQLAASVCFGVSGDRFANLDKKRDTLSAVGFPDTLFFKRAADPILAHDPFSSLMWALFCLPLPFLSSSELFIPLVHIFYCVCVVQALLTCYSRDYFDVSCFHDSTLNDICKKMGESECVRTYFISNYIDVTGHPKDMIRRFTFPYLRRCALLSKMLQYENPPASKSNLYVQGGTLDSANSVELGAIKELEDMFQIHSLELVLKNEVMHSLALKWCHHFSVESNVRNCGIALVSTPAVPFKLIQLPRLYQDLLQRYIKLQCSSCKSVPDEPALCLLCGKLCSPSWKSCCRASRCLNHATICGAGIGVFLLVRRTTVFLQRYSRESSWPSPYLDAFGEEDRDMLRGRPLHLNEERYAALTYLVASHGLDRTSEVLRQTTINHFGDE